MENLTDNALDNQLERYKSNLLYYGPNLPDNGEKIRCKIASLEEEKQRRASQRSKMENLTDNALDNQLERYKSNLLYYGPNLPDNGEKIRCKIASLEEEKQRRASQRSKMENLTDNALDNQLERYKSNLLYYGPNLPDNGEKIRCKIASLEEEKQRRASQRSKMCTNGHIACSLCCTKLRKRCHFCRSHIGDIRCRAMEKVIEASIVPCRNAVYGCKETTSYGDQAKHEKLCVYIRCSCPIPKCNYIGSYTDLETHARDSHSRDPENLIPFVFNSPQIFGMNLARRKIAVFQEEKEGYVMNVDMFMRK